ncbi:MAG: BglG family transcription antiterminator [Erysipelotrichaceae bacterium]
MKLKEYKVLLYLFNNKGEFITSMKLANEFSISERTVRNYVKNLQFIAKENKAEIIAKQGLGYKLNTSNPIEFERFIKRNALNDKDYTLEKKIIDTSDKRQSYILSKILLKDNEKIYFNKLLDRFSISPSTLNKEINKIKKLLKTYDLSLHNNSYDGLSILGAESDKRAFIIDYFFKEIKFNSIQEYAYQTSYFDDMPIAKLIMIVLSECRSLEIKLSDIIIQNILIHLMLSIKRLSKKIVCKKFEIDFPENQNLEVQVATNIIKRIEAEMNFKFPPEEISYLTLHLSVKSNKNFLSDSVNFGKIENELDLVLFRLDNENDYNLSNDSILKDSLIEHLKAMMLRISKSVNLKNPLLNDILSEYKDIYDLTKKYLSQMPTLANIEVTDDEYAYLALHFMSSVMRSQKRTTINVLVICSTGKGSAQLLKNRIQKELGDKLTIVSEIGYFELNDKMLEGIDLIISSINISSIILGVPTIHVSVFLQENDINKIEEFINKKFNNKTRKNTENICQLKKIENSKIFDYYLQIDKFFTFKQPTNRDEVVKTLVASLSRGEKNSFVRKMLDQIDLREQMGLIVFSDSVAVPHPAIPFADQAGIAVGVIPNGVHWDHDYPNIKFVFLVSPSRMGDQEIKIITQTIVNFIDYPQLQNRVIKSLEFKVFKEIFLSLM